jgi:murein DD-endopeptidase MepM/ murein hydrolase activator NlpD
MSHWIHFKYNKKKGRYERSKPSPWRHLLSVAQHLMSGSLMGVILLYGFIYFVGSPREWRLEREYDLLKRQYRLLESRMDVALDVMEDIGQRDDNLYRVILQGDPIGEANRNAIIDNAYRYDSLQSLPDAQLVLSVSRKMDLLERQLYLQSKSFDEIVALCRNQEDRLQCIPAIQPVADKNLKQVASGYGWRTDPIYNTRKFHSGMDFSANKGTDVFVTGNGRVISAGWQQGYGQCIDVDHGYGYVTRYGHLSKINVFKGRVVKRGDKIGEVGSTGKSTGPHLHYEVLLRGVPQNPADYYFMDLTPEAYDELIQRSENVGQVMD